MRAGQRKPSVVVIEGCRGPGRCVVASRARGREAASNMIRTCRPCVIGLVARVAVCWHSRVVVVHMALRAGYGDMCAGERERCRAMVKGRSGPSRGVVAGRASGGESRGGMRWTVGSVVVSLVAAEAGSRQSGVVVVRVALCARDADMSAG